MNNHTNTPQDDELEGFDAFEEEALSEDAALADEPIDDADFQDISDDVDADVFGESEPAPAPKKKTSWFNIGVAAIAIAVAGGLVFMKLGPTLMGGGDTAVNAPVAGGPDPVPSPGAPAPASDAQAAAQAALVPENQPGAAGKMPGLLDAPEQFANLSAMQGGATPAPAAPAPSANDPFAGVPIQIPAGAPAPVAAMPAPDQAQVPMPAPIAPAPVATSSMPSPDAAMPAPAANTIQPETLPAPAPAAAVAIPAADTSALETKVSSLENRLNDMDNKLSAIAQAPAVNDSRLNSIQTTLERLESRLDDVVTRKTPAVREVSAPSDGPSEASPAPVKRTTTVRKAAAPKKAKKDQWDEAYSPSRSTPVAASSSGSGGWELRGATPGRATLARGNDIREIGIGESVPGLGEITGVAQMNGKWVVQGTQGRLAQ